MILDILKSLSEGTRLRMLTLLSRTKEPVCVGYVEYILDISAPNASRHLKRLLADDLVITKRHNQSIHYYINDEMLEKNKFIRDLLDENFKQSEDCQTDFANLQHILSLNIEQLRELANIKRIKIR